MMTTFGRLPPEIVSLILQQLSRQRDLYECAIVNKTWNTTATPLLWQQPSLRYDHNLRETFFICLATASHPIGQHIRVVKWYYINYEDKHLLCLIKHARSLQRLEISKAHNITDASVEPLARTCRDLTTLFLCTSPITHISIDSLNEHCHQLSNLALIDCHNIPSTTFLRLAHCPLQGICFKIRDWHLYSLDSLYSWSALQERIPDFVRFDRLTSLVFHEPSTSFVLSLLSTSQTPTTTTNSRVRWPYLTHLTLTHPDANLTTVNYRINRLNSFDEEEEKQNMDKVEDYFITFFQTHPHLCSVILRGYPLGARVLEAMAAFLPNLSILDLSWNKKIEPHDIRQLVMHCPTLTYIYMDHCGLSWDDFPEIVHVYNKSRYKCRFDLRPFPSRLCNLHQTLINQIRGDDSDGSVSYLELLTEPRVTWWQ
ncbi:hypothetical protein BCR42DRAFT_426053 [Absidia repens]|uniref:F-box domain-containing protein n=1 Tax=Absidia repens TaxID=90262 RepID=A0A1X2I1N0_9FUNG|nr:hypothetical protein BCR42DRAFT_426053 [Absidia repens]